MVNLLLSFLVTVWCHRGYAVVVCCCSVSASVTRLSKDESLSGAFAPSGFDRAARLRQPTCQRRRGEARTDKGCVQPWNSLLAKAKKFPRRGVIAAFERHTLSNSFSYEKETSLLPCHCTATHPDRSAGAPPPEKSNCMTKCLLKLKVRRGATYAFHRTCSLGGVMCWDLHRRHSSLFPLTCATAAGLNLGGGLISLKQNTGGSH